MNYRIIARNLGIFSLWVAVWMVASSLWSLWYGEAEALRALLEAAAASALSGGVLVFLGQGQHRRMYERESVALVGLGWIFISALGALPFLFYGGMTFTDAYFESMSGFTTTGSSVISEIESLPKGILFWRSLTHWLGGLGVVVLMVAVIPFIGLTGKMLYQSEVTGLSKDGVRPRIKESAFVLLKVYGVLTVIHVAALMVAGMDLYDALCHTFGSLATGGFSTRNKSIEAFNSLPIETTITVFELVGATNFTLYYLMARGDWKALFRNTEWRVFIAIFLVSCTLVTLNLLGVQGEVAADASVPGASGAADYTPGQAVRFSSFQVATMMTNTGFTGADFNIWPYFSRIWIMMIVMMGGCAGSTAGGLKIIRVVILFKIGAQQIQRIFRPHTLRAIRVNGQVVSEDIQYSVLSFFLVYVAVTAFSTVVMSFLGLPLESAFSSVVACLNNTGPGLGMVGAETNFACVPAAGKWFLSLVMVTGRLEFFSVMVFFFPSFWRRG
ncbi:MAG TPA: TrkH family potassium uptake protein [Candidatus Hydrogenedentes bacterium]|nr:TrkH family potassium uptake protein [Candidatus Hydrogenedentota bacterium]